MEMVLRDVPVVAPHLTGDLNMNSRVYRLEMEMHRKRVLSLATVVYELIPGSKSTTEKTPEILLLEQYLELHDAPKIQGIAELAVHGYENSATIAERLTNFYGENQESLDEERGEDLQTLIQELNEMEMRLKESFFKEHDIGHEMRERFVRAEMIADITDTGIARQIEMGLTQRPYNGYSFLLKRGDLHGAQLSKWLEDNYREILKKQLS